MDKSLNRGMFNKFESRKISVAGYQCDNSDFHFWISEHKELPVIKSVPMKEETIVDNWNQNGLRLLLELLW